MKKLFLTLFAALMSWTGVNAQTDEEYYAALAAIDNGASYYITTDVSGTKYYLTNDGHLTNALGSAGTFTLTQSNPASGNFKATGFKIHGTTYFTNPPGTSDSNLTQNNYISTNNEGRDLWEDQVLFLNKNGKYAVRCTNAATGSNWNYVGNAYWTVNDGPVAQYSFTVNYIWNFEKVGDVTYTHVNSTRPTSNNGEEAGSLIDGVGSTKWGEGLTTGNPRWIIFKTDRAISPTQYKLTVANDTYGDQRRQWTKWKIYGANFYSEKLATKDATEWVLLDQQNCPSNSEFPVGSANRTYSHTDFNMSENNTGYYQYFKIVVEEIRTSGAYMQMGDFRFKTFNAKTVGETWQTKVTLAQTFDRGTLAADYPIYTEYSGYSTGLTSDLSSANSSGNYSTLESHLDYIVELRRVMSDYIGGRDFSGLDGTACWGDGFYDNLVDGDNSTKWGGDFSGSVGDPEHVQWTIFRAKTPIKPYFYNLRTAWDAEGWGGRNWKDWKIYGGNFATMNAAVRGATWTLIDERSDVGRDLLPAKNSYLAPFGTSEYASLSEEYSYFKVEVSAAYTDAKIQMNELTLGTEAEFTATKNAYLDELNDYTPPSAASSRLKDEYKDAVEDVEDATPENILAKYNAAKAKQMEIFESLKDGNDYYHLYSAVDLGLFADVVNGEGGNLGAKAKLEADIDLSGMTLMKIGSNGQYSGEFDGQNHVISHLSFSDQAGGRTGMFGYTGGATIKNIIFEEANVGGRNNLSVVVGEATNGTIQNIKVRNSVARNIAGGGDRSGFIAGQANGTTIKNCAVINSKMTGHNFAGAIVGYAIGGATVQNCYSNAVVEAASSYAGGIAGAAETATIEKTLFTGTVKSISDVAAGVVGKFNVADNQNYTLVLRNNMVAAATVKAPSTRTLVYLPSFPESQTTNPTYADNYILRCGAHSDEVKGVTNKDDQNGKNMERSEVTVSSFYTDLGWDMTDDWTFVADGLFPILKGMESDIDLIESASDLNAFATKINNGGYSFLARLTADITASADFTPIGTDTYKYFGTFDGQGHKVTLAIDRTSQSYQGLFGKAQGGADFRNLIVAGSVAGYQSSAALVGEIKSEDGAGKAGTVYVDHVGCEAAVSGAEANAYTGAFVGNVWGSRINLEVYNSYNTGAISGTGVVSVFGNVNGNSKFTNVYNSGTISLNKMDNNGNGNYTNCYTNTTGTTKDGLTNGITAEQFASGEICYLLNGDQSSIVFYQAVGTDNDPTLKSASGQVYIHGTVCPDDGPRHDDIEYNNTEGSLTTGHNYVDGFCSYCRALQSDYMAATDGYYLIGTPAQFKWFGAYVNAGNTSVNGKLTANINLSGVAWTPIGNYSNRYTGTFDGQNHAITNFSYTSTGDYNGLFGAIDGATVKDFSISGSLTSTHKENGVVGYAYSSSTAPQICGIHSSLTITVTDCSTHTGGIVGGSDAVIENCSYSGALTINGNDSHTDVTGGIAGYAGKGSIRNCLFSGTVLGACNKPFGGILGYVNDDSFYLENCLSIGTVSSTGDSPVVAALVGRLRNADVTKCKNNYYYVPTGSATTGYSGNSSESDAAFNENLEAAHEINATQLSSGEVTYKLNKNCCYDVAWTQTLGTDDNPTLDKTKGIVNKISSVGYTTQYIGSTDVTIPEDVEAYAGVINGNWLSLRKIEDAISKDDAVILKGSEGYYSFVPTAGASAATLNNLQGSTGITVGAEDDFYALANKGGIGFYPVGEGVTIPAGKAYLEVSGGNVKGYTFVFDDTEDGINSLTPALSEGEGVVYNLAGQRINKMQKGINIVNGKKIMK